MKDSGIPWVGKIPEDWGVEPLRQFFTERKHKNTDGAEDNLLSLSYGRIIRKDIDSSDGLLPASFLGYNIVESGDIVFRMTDLQNDKKSLRSGLVGERGIITSAYITVAPKRGVESRFHSYLQRAYDQLKVYYNMGSGVRQGINYGDLKRMPVLAPSFDEQQRIADYLDARCREIDAVKQTLSDEVEALQRLRKATIHKAVTKGLDESVPMKDSGVEWIGEIPETWDCLRQKHVVRLINGRAYANNEFEQDGRYRILRVGNLFSNPTWYTSSMELPPDKYCEDGDLLYSWSMSYGPHIWHGERVIYHYHIWKVALKDSIRKRFAFYYLDALTDAVQSEIHETTMGFLTMGIMNNSYIALPSLPEQQHIADYLDERCAAIDSVIETRTKQLERLEDYRKALVFAYVTGKKEVPRT